MKKLIIAIFFFIPFIAQSQEIPPAYFNPTDSSIYITKLISGVVTRYKYKLQPASNPIPISTLLAADRTNSINNGSFIQSWAWDALSNDVGLSLSSSSTAASGGGQTLLSVYSNGANSNASQTTYAANINNAHSGTSSTNVALISQASGGTNNYAIIVPPTGGSVGIGTSLPTSKLHVVSTQTTGVGSTFTSSTTTTGSILDITGTSTALAANNEGLNIGISGANGTNAITATGATISVTNTNATSGTNVGIDITASGATTNNLHLLLREPAASGTNYTAFKTVAQAADIVYSLPPTVGGAGTTLTDVAGNGVLTWAAAGGGITVGTTTITSGTSGAIPFNDGGVYGEEATELFWDKTNNRLGVGTNAPQHDIHIKRASASAILDLETTSASEQVQLRFVTNSGVWRFMNGGSGSGFAGSLSLREENFAQNPIVFRSGSDGLGVGIGANTTLHSAASATLYVTGSAVGINNSNTTPTAQLKIGAGSASASTAPLKLTSGTINTTAEAGAVEYNGTHYITKASGLRIALEGTIADFYTDVNNGTTVETDIYSYTTPASTLGADGEKIFFAYTLNLSDVTATATIKCYFAGTSIANTGALTVSATGAVLVQGWIVRTAATTARASVNISSPTASTAVYTSQTDLTGLTLSGTNIVKVTAQAGGAGGGSNDITGKSGTVSWRGAAAN